MICAVLVLSSFWPAGDACNTTIHAKAFESARVELYQGRNAYCIIWIVADTATPTFQIDLSFNSSTARAISASPDPLSCSASSSYIHVGNDVHRVNELSLTSYWFCGDVNELPPPIVSRGQVMWVAYFNQSLPITIAYSILPTGMYFKLWCYKLWL